MQRSEQRMRTVEKQWNVTCSDWSQIRPGWGSRLSAGAEVVALSVTAMAVPNAIFAEDTSEPSYGSGGQWPVPLGEGPWFIPGPIQVGFVMEKVP